MLKRTLIVLLLGHTFLLAQFENYQTEKITSDPIRDLKSKRKITALIYSTFIPGAGQFYLGHKLKGAIFTISAFGSLVTAIVSENNLVGGNERLENLEIQYQSTMNWEKADQIWQEMLQVKSDIDKDYKRRNLFIGITAGIWLANIIDVLFFTPDKGAGDIFGDSTLWIENKNGNLLISAKINLQEIQNLYARKN